MNFFKYKFLILSVALLSILACTEDIQIDNGVENPLENAGRVFGSVKSMTDARLFPMLQVPVAGLQHEIYFELNTKLSVITDVEVAVDEDLVAHYNETHELSYLPFPAESVTFSQGGKMSVAPGDYSSTAITLNIAVSNELVKRQVYMLPIVFNTQGGNIEKKVEAHYMLIEYIGEQMAGGKGNNFKIFSCDGDNPLNHLEFTLKDSGRYLFDVLVMFSGNIEYNADEMRVNFMFNSKFKSIYGDYDTYVKPLKDEGIKVIMSVMPNHTIASLSNLTPEVIDAFVKDLKTYADVYHFDGFFWDDEYSKDSGDTPGFDEDGNGSMNVSRLIYATKIAMPDKMQIAYAYGSTSRLSTVNGVTPGQYLDYVHADYGNTVSDSGYEGLVESQMCHRSQEYALERSPINASTFKGLIDRGSGGMMVFSLDPTRDNFHSFQLPNMQILAKGAYGEDIVWSGVFHHEDWN